MTFSNHPFLRCEHSLCSQDDDEREDSASPSPKKTLAAKGKPEKCAADEDGEGLPKTIIPPRPIKRRRKEELERDIFADDDELEGGRKSAKTKPAAGVAVKRETPGNNDYGEAGDDSLAELVALASKSCSGL